MSLLTLSNLRKDYGARRVLDAVSLRVARGEKIGIVGRNGGGKTTLLRLIMGSETPDAGSVHVARGIRLGYLAQIARMDETRTVREEAETALAVLLDAEAELRETEAALAERPEDEDALDAYGAARDRWEFAGGDRARDNLVGALEAMGLAGTDLEKRVAVLSGGEKTRLAMAKLLASSPDVLVLDEPTNHLDIRAVEWLEAFLQRFPGAVLLVSHDRRLLSAVAQTVWEVEAMGVESFSGAPRTGSVFDSYREQRAANRQRQQEEWARQQAEIEKLEAFIRKNKEGQQARQARSREKALARMERTERPVAEGPSMKARLASSGRSGLDVVVAERASKRYGEKALLVNATFTIRRGERVGIVGPNGVGKTTLVKMILGHESPDTGYLRYGYGVTVAHREQDVDDFDPDLSVLENFYERAGMSIGEARAHLARFLFSGEDVFKPVSALSGGERAKLAMALLVLSPANLLILDEPTNHLDVDSCEALTESLLRYDGTLLLVSHDRALLDSVTNRTLALEGDGRFVLVEGPYSAYREAIGAASGVATAPPGPKPDPAAAARSDGALLNAYQLSKERQRAAKRVAMLETDVAALEARLTEIEQGLSAPASADIALSLASQHTELKDTIAARLAEWEAAVVEAEALGAL